jgi:hypothetical protein
LLKLGKIGMASNVCKGGGWVWGGVGVGVGGVGLEGRGWIRGDSRQRRMNEGGAGAQGEHKIDVSRRLLFKH